MSEVWRRGVVCWDLCLLSDWWQVLGRWSGTHTEASHMAQACKELKITVKTIGSMTVTVSVRCDTRLGCWPQVAARPSGSCLGMVTRGEPRTLVRYMKAVFRIKRVFSFEEVMGAAASPPEHQDLASLSYLPWQSLGGGAVLLKCPLSPFCLASLIIRGLQIKNSTRCHISLVSPVEAK